MGPHKLLRQNSKMKKSSNAEYLVVNWTLPAGKTCPAAGECAKWCYAKKGAFSWKNVKASHQRNYQLTLEPLDFIEKMSQDIDWWQKKATKNGQKLCVRIHDSGDFYDHKYLGSWLTIIDLHADVFFYAYTKQVRLMRPWMDEPLDNFRVIFSEGGIMDKLIKVETQRHSRVFNSIKDLLSAGYINASDDDLVAAFNENHKIGLVLH